MQFFLIVWPTRNCTHDVLSKVPRGSSLFTKVLVNKVNIECGEKKRAGAS